MSAWILKQTGEVTCVFVCTASIQRLFSGLRTPGQSVNLIIMSSQPMDHIAFLTNVYHYDHPVLIASGGETNQKLDCHCHSVRVLWTVVRVLLWCFNTLLCDFWLG